MEINLNLNFLYVQLIYYYIKGLWNIELKSNSIRKAIPKNKDKKIDLLLVFSKQSFIPRLTFLIYTNKNYSYKDFYLRNIGIFI